MPLTDRRPVFTFNIDILLLQENGTWIAQGLQYDIAGQGEDTECALERFFQTMIGQMIGDLRAKEEPLVNVGCAPKLYWDKFKEARQLTEQRAKRFAPEDVPPYMIKANELRIAA